LEKEMTAEPPHILVVDDDNRLRQLLRKYLTENGFRVSAACDAADARRKLEGLTFDLIVLDLMMPGEHGLDFAAGLRRRSATPILMLTAMGEPEDRIAGFERGADDYLAKPFEPRELLLRIRSVLRRLPGAVSEKREVRLGAAVFDPNSERLVQNGRQIRLTSIEAALLSALAVQPGTIVSREELSERTGTGGGRAIDVQVTRLRRKIEPDPKLPRYLQTVRGRGYVLRPD
jgi:two-component system, OmpR family, phosphate regulon response regulator OmpR